jgi:hypothetical protein
LPKAAHVGRHDMETGFGQRRDLMPPGIGQFRPAVAKQHKRTVALFTHEQIDAVGGNRACGEHRVSALLLDFVG